MRSASQQALTLWRRYVAGRRPACSPRAFVTICHPANVGLDPNIARAMLFSSAPSEGDAEQVPRAHRIRALGGLRRCKSAP
uniref:Uncharacterized protein n=1 Tax=mine drainage metagenome TaxID=410659 RepID=E6PPR1_9ZZZZ